MSKAEVDRAIEVTREALSSPVRCSGAAPRMARQAAGEMSLARSAGKAGAACAAEVRAMPVFVLVLA
jgi:hypothetical protein